MDDVWMAKILERLDEIADRLSPPAVSLPEMSIRAMEEKSEKDFPPDMWDRFGVRWTCKGKRRDPYRDLLLWESVQPIGSGHERIATLTGEELEERGPFTSKSPLAEDQEQDPSAGKDTDPVDPDHESYSTGWERVEEVQVAFDDDERAYLPGDLSKRIRQLEADNAALRKRLGDWADAVPEQTGETDGELLARLGTDAQQWAAEFVRLFLGHTIGPRSKVDEALMIAWFEAALETGRSVGRAERS